MSWPKGKPRPPGAGRQKGTPNRVTRRVKETLEAVLAESETEERLRALRDSDESADRSTFWRLAGRCVPNEIAAKVDAGIRLKVVDRSDSAPIGRDDDGQLPEPRQAAADEGPPVLDLRTTPTPELLPVPAVAPLFFQRPIEDFQDSADFD